MRMSLLLLQHQHQHQKNAILTITCRHLFPRRAMMMTRAAATKSRRWYHSSSLLLSLSLPRFNEQSQQQQQQLWMRAITSTTTSSRRFFGSSSSSCNHPTKNNTEPSSSSSVSKVALMDAVVVNEKSRIGSSSSSSSDNDDDLVVVGQQSTKKQEGVIQEAELLSETTTETTTTAAAAAQKAQDMDVDDDHDDDDDDHDHDDDDDDMDTLVLGDDWFGSTPSNNKEAYQKIIDTARLTAELAYERNNAMVGALAEAGGDEGAAERWLLGFVTLIQQHLPQWWSKKDDNTDKDNYDDDIDNSNHPHRNALLALANNRRGDYFIKRCIDPLVLKERMGAADFAIAQMVALEVLDEVTLSGSHGAREEKEEGGGGSDADMKQYFPLSKEAIEGAKAIWGEETMAELNKKTQEEIENEMEMKDLERSGLVGKMEEGEWWGPATHAAPDQAYQRLIDAARYGSMLAYEKQGQYIGAVADAIEASDGNYNNGSIDDYMNMEEDENINEQGSTAADINYDDESESDDRDMEEDESINEPAFTADSDNEAGSDSDRDDESDGDSESDRDDKSDGDSESDRDDKSDGDSESDSDRDDKSDGDSDSYTDDKSDGDSDKDDESDGDEKMDMQENETNNEEGTTTNDSVYNPTELGPNAESHFEQFLQQIKKANMMPPWWNEEHEDALWQLASDKEGKHFLGYPMDRDELKEIYDAGVRHKVSTLAEAAAADMDGSDQPFFSDMDALKGMEDGDVGGDFMSDMDDVRSNEEDDDSSKKDGNLKQ